MLIKTRRSFVIILATVLVVGFGIMALTLAKKVGLRNSYDKTDVQLKELTTQSDSNSVELIEDDLMETDLSEIDTELQDIENEINSTN